MLDFGRAAFERKQKKRADGEAGAFFSICRTLAAEQTPRRALAVSSCGEPNRKPWLAHVKPALYGGACHAS